MKILIIGEFSAFSKYLSRGFHAIGHESFVFSWGDSFKRVVQDNDSYFINTRNIRIFKHDIKGTNRIKRPFTAMRLHRFIAKMPHDWDAAIIINLGFLQIKHNIFNDLISFDEIQSLLKDKTQVYLSACGGDYIFDLYFPNRRKICPAYVKKSQDNLAYSNTELLFHTFIHRIKGIIPITIGYYDAYKHYIDIYHYKLFRVIPLPFDIDSVSVSNEIKGKIVIMHGVNRYYEKGSDIIIPAMERIKNDYPDLVDLRIVTRVSLNEYLSIMQEANIVIDQAYADSAGMNAVEALAMGKVVLGGDEPGNAESLGVSEYPVIDIVPDEDYIYSVLKELILNPERIKRISKQSRDTAANVYDCRIVAARYIQLFNEEAKKNL